MESKYRNERDEETDASLRDALERLRFSYPATPTDCMVSELREAFGWDGSGVLTQAYFEERVSQWKEEIGWGAEKDAAPRVTSDLAAATPPVDTRTLGGEQLELASSSVGYRQTNRGSLMSRPRPTDAQNAGLRDTCWICDKKIQPQKAPRALCAHCATGGGLGPYT